MSAYDVEVLTLIALLVALLFLPSPWNAALVATAAVIDVAETVVFVWWSRRRRRLTAPAVGSETVVGRSAIALGRLDPDGQVRIDGEIWRARALTAIDPGVTVRVVSLDDLTLTVTADTSQPCGH